MLPRSLHGLRKVLIDMYRQLDLLGNAPNSLSLVSDETNLCVKLAFWKTKAKFGKIFRLVTSAIGCEGNVPLKGKMASQCLIDGSIKVVMF